MLMGHTIGLRDHSSSNELLPADPVSELDDDEAEIFGKILFRASFDELARSNLQYDTIIWVLISLLLVLAWGVGIIMLLYLPVRRYVLQKDISSRKLYVTTNEIVYKVSRPSFIPFWGVTKIEKNVPLALVIDIIIEQGCLQSVYGIHTLRVESIAHGKAAPVDELQVQGVSNPGLLRKVILAEASKSILEIDRSWKSTAYPGDGESILGRTGSVSEGPVVGRSPSKGWKVTGSPRHSLLEGRSVLPGGLLLHKIEEVKQSVKSKQKKKEKAFMGGGEHGHGEGAHGDFRTKVWSMTGGPNCRPKHWKRNTAIAMAGIVLICIPIAMKSAELELPGWEEDLTEKIAERISMREPSESSDKSLGLHECRGTATWRLIPEISSFYKKSMDTFNVLINLFAQYLRSSGARILEIRNTKFWFVGQKSVVVRPPKYCDMAKNLHAFWACSLQRIYAVIRGCVFSNDCKHMNQLPVEMNYLIFIRINC
ncbi:hypothetical protein HHK36_027768 [Tetracentron sinense]|uniref:DUF7642 domain-containing protein n=1 Tax=Tetracentron sinense TaxID=13715 RepID=A0A834YDS7_TETSI|nr:hypothetical protein HHK36_027768 [Tetracentron sinense]